MTLITINELLAIVRQQAATIQEMQHEIEKIKRQIGTSDPNPDEQLMNDLQLRADERRLFRKALVQLRRQGYLSAPANQPRRANSLGLLHVIAESLCRLVGKGDTQWRHFQRLWGVKDLRKRLPSKKQEPEAMKIRAIIRGIYLE